MLIVRLRIAIGSNQPSLLAPHPIGIDQLQNSSKNHPHTGVRWKLNSFITRRCCPLLASVGIRALSTIIHRMQRLA